MADLVFLYGPPAVGKFTVAKQLSEHFGWPLLHNHIVIDCVQAVLQRGEPGFIEACADVRLALVRHALAAGRSCIMTFVYAEGIDDSFVQALHAAVLASGGRWLPIQLRCSDESLNLRCSAPHREPMGKISDPQTLHEVLSRHNCHAPLPGGAVMSIDTERYAPAEVAVQIVEALSSEGFGAS